MKLIFSSFVLLFVFASISAQKSNNKVVFIFEDEMENMRKERNLFKIEDFNFRKLKKSNSEMMVDLEFIKTDLKSISEFREMIKGKPFPGVPKGFKYFLYVPESKTRGCLIAVERIWVIDEPIID